MDSIQIFHSEQFGDIRTAGNSENPLFCLSDLCKALNLTTPAKVSKRLDDEDVTSIHTPTTSGNQLMTFVTESGMYTVILRSDSPLAKPMQKWVTSEVLPSIRKQGGYIASTPEETPEEIMAKALVVAQSTIDRMKEQNRSQSRELIQSAPKVEYFDTVLQSQSTYCTDQIAKEFGMTAIALNRILFAKEVQFKRGDQWVLTAKYAGRGYTKTKTHSYTDADGYIRTKMLTVWTEAGRLFIHKLLKPA